MATQLCPHSTSAWRGDPKHPSKACRFLSTPVAQTYRAAGQAATSLHAMHEGRAGPGLLPELRATTHLALWATKVTTRSLGQVMSTYVVQKKLAEPGRYVQG